MKNNNSTRLRGFLTLVLSITLALAIAGLFYILEIKQNEKYQNQLHFRELKDMASALDNGIIQLYNVTKELYEIKKKDETVEKSRQIFSENLNELFDRINKHARKFESTLAKENKYFQQLNAKNEALEKKQNLIATKKESRLSLYTEQKKAEGQYQVLRHQIIDKLRDKKGYFEWELDACKQEVSCDFSFLLGLLDKETFKNMVTDQAVLTHYEQTVLELDKSSQLIKHLTNNISQLDNISKTIKENLIYVKNKNYRSIQPTNVETELINLEDYDSGIEEYRASISYKLGFVPSEQVTAFKEISDTLLREQQDLSDFYSWKVEAINAVLPLISESEFKKNIIKYTVSYNKNKKEIEVLNKEINTLESNFISKTTGPEKVHFDGPELVSLRTKIVSNLKKLSKKIDKIKCVPNTTHREACFLPVANDYVKLVNFGDKYNNCIKGFVHENKDFKLKDCKHSSANFSNIIREHIDIEGDFDGLVRTGLALKRAHITLGESTGLDMRGNDASIQFDLKPLTQYEEKWPDTEWILSARHIKGAWRIDVPFEDLLYLTPKHYPVLLLVGEQGQQLVRKDNITLDATQHGLEFKQLDMVIKHMIKKQYPKIKTNSQSQVQTTVLQVSQFEKADKIGNVGYSDYLDIEVAGEAYRLFITPYTNPLLRDKDNEKHLYLIGFRKKSVLMASKLLVSNSLVIAALIVLVLVLALLPILKLRLLSSQQGVGRGHQGLIIFGLLLFFCVLGIGLGDFVKYTGVKNQRIDRNEKVFGQIVESFEKEVTHLMALAHKQDKNKQWPEMGDPEIMDYFLDHRPGLENKETNTVNDYILENVILLHGKGKLKIKDKAYFSSLSLKRFSDIDLSHRDYFNKAYTCEHWLPQGVKDCSKGIFIERLYNKRDARPATQISTLLPPKKINWSQNKSVEKEVLAFGVKLHTFLSPVLPVDTGFLIFENETGDVLYHSEESRALVENVFIETDNNGKLHALFNAGKTPDKPISFTSKYRGQDHLFTVNGIEIKLKDGQVSLPWSLVVFYQKDAFRTVNMLSVITSLSLLVLVIGALFVLCTVLPFSYLRRLFWFSGRAGKGHSRRWLINSYSLKIGAFVTVCALLSILLFNSIFNAYWATYQSYGAVQAKSSAASAAKKYKDYRDSVLDYKRTGVSQKPSSELLLPCFSGEDPALLKQEKCAGNFGSVNNMSAQPWAAKLIHPLLGNNNDGYGIDDMLWAQSGRMQLKSTSTSSKDTTVAYSVVMASEGLRDLNKWVLLASIVVSLLLFALGKLLIRDWLVGRLMGGDIPLNFRIKEDNCRKITIIGKDTPINKISDQKNQVIIRPTPMRIQELSEKVPGTQSNANEQIHFVTHGPVTITHLCMLATDSVTVAQALKIGNSSGVNQVLVIKGLEVINLVCEHRLQALSVLEELNEINNLKLILLCDVAPLYRMTEQGAYPNNLSPDEYASTSEVMRWTSLMRDFVKIYDWTGGEKYMPANIHDCQDVLNHEATGWPELSQIRDEFLGYHQVAKMNQPNVKLGVDLTEEVRQTLDEKWEPEQIIEFFAANCGSFYRYHWELCTKAERLLLYEMAMGHEPNPANLEPLEHLTSRGYIFYDHGWHLNNESFKRFVISAEDPERLNEWLLEAQESYWKYLRIPLFAILIAIVAIGAYSATEAIESMVGVLAGILGLIPLAMHGFSVTRSIASVTEN